MELKETIETRRIILKRPYPPTFKLARQLYAEIKISQENLRPWLPWADKKYTKEDSFRYLTDWCEKNWKKGEGFAYIIYDKEKGQILGSIDAMNVDEKNKSCEIGYWLSVNAQGHGYMAEAVAALEQECFAAGIHRIVIGNDTRNTRSANVAKRAGYQLEGVLRQNRWSDYDQAFVDSNVWAKVKG